MHQFCFVDRQFVGFVFKWVVQEKKIRRVQHVCDSVVFQEFKSSNQKKKKTRTHALNFFAMDDSSIQESSYPSLSMINFSIYYKVVCPFALYLPHRMAALLRVTMGASSRVQAALSIELLRINVQVFTIYLDLHTLSPI